LLTFKIMEHFQIKDQLKIKPSGTKVFNIYEELKAVIKSQLSANNMLFTFHFRKRKSFLYYRQY